MKDNEPPFSSVLTYFAVFVAPGIQSKECSYRVSPQIESHGFEFTGQSCVDSSIRYVSAPVSNSEIFRSNGNICSDFHTPPPAN